MEVTEGDGDKFDGHHSEESKDCYISMCKEMGAPERVTAGLSAQKDIRGFTRNGLTLKAGCVMASGVPNTTVENSTLNMWNIAYACFTAALAMGLVTTFACEMPFTIFVAGDDLLIVAIAGLTSHPAFTECLEKSGFEYTFLRRQGEDIVLSSYNSGLFWPCRVWDSLNQLWRTTLSWGPLIGRTLCKVGYTDKNPGKRNGVKSKGYAKAAATSLLHLAGHVPILRDLALRVLELAGDVLPIYENHRHIDAIQPNTELVTMTEEQHPFFANTWTFMETVYGVGKRAVALFRERLEDVSELATQVADPLVTNLIQAESQIPDTVVEVEVESGDSY